MFGRKSRSEKLAETVAEAVKTSLAGSPYANSGYASVSAAEPTTGMAGQGLIQKPGIFDPMPRPGGAFGAMLGPSAPLIPAAIDTVLDDSGRPLPRKYEYQVAINLNLTQTEVPYQVLKSLSEQCDIVRRCIDIRISDILKMSWSFTLSEQAVSTIMKEKNVGHAEASRMGREIFGDEINRLQDFWENPYVATDRGWAEWITEALNQHFVYDQLCVYPRYTLGKKLMGFDIIDAPTIKMLLDNRGDIPHPPAPAFQQVLWGFPRGEFTASPDADGNFFAGPGRRGEFMTDQLSVYVKNRRTHSPYGFSQVEQSIPAATLYLDRQTWMRSEYIEGATPMTWMRTNSMELDLPKLQEYERILNGKLAGSTAERHRIKVLPDGFEPVAMPTIDERFKPEYDEYLKKSIGSIFGVDPTQLGIIPRTGLGGRGATEAQAEQTDTVSQLPLMNWVIEVVNGLSRRYLGADKNVTFVLEDMTSGQDELTKAKAYQLAVASGTMTLNDVRGELGEPLYDMPEADEPMVVAGNAVQFLKGMLGGSDGGAGNSTGAGEEAQAPPQAQGQGAPPEGAQGSQGSQGQGQEGPGSGKEAKADLKAQEAKAFQKFASKPRTREFEFLYHTPEEIAVLKAGQVEVGKALLTKRNKEDLTNHPHLSVVANKHKKALLAALGVSGVERAISQAMRGAKGLTDPSTIKALAMGAALANITTSPHGVTVLQSIYHDAGTRGSAQAAKDISGSPYLGQGLQSVLNQAGITIKGINDTTVNRIGGAIANGMTNGQSAREIGTAVNAIINDPTRADIIATTEANRAYIAASMDTFAQAGVTSYTWVAYAGACEICVDLAGPHTIGDPVPPAHPACQCDVTGNVQ